MIRAARFWIVAAFLCGPAGPRAALADTLGAPAGEPPDSLGAHEAPLAWSATYASRYRFQGLDYSQGRPVLQPQVSGRLRGITLALWGNLDQDRRELNEADASLQGDRDFGSLSGALGYTYLRYPHRDWEPTHEVFADLALAGPLQPALSVHWDVAAGRGRYWTLGFSHDIPRRGATVGLAAKLYAHEHYYGMTGIPALETSVSVMASWAGILFQPSLARLSTWENGHFRDDQTVSAGWVLSFTCSSP